MYIHVVAIKGMLIGSAYRWAVVLGFSYLLLNLYSYVWPEWVCGLLSLVTLVSLVLTILASIILGFAKWRNQSRLWIGPAVVCLLFVSGTWWTPPLGRFIADRSFSRQLAEYNEVVSEIRSDANSPLPTASTSLSIFEAKHPPRYVRLDQGCPLWQRRCGCCVSVEYGCSPTS